jgi:hypothetical protein
LSGRPLMGERVVNFPPEKLAHHEVTGSVTADRNTTQEDRRPSAPVAQPAPAGERRELGCEQGTLS